MTSRERIRTWFNRGIGKPEDDVLVPDKQNEDYLDAWVAFEQWWDDPTMESAWNLYVENALVKSLYKKLEVKVKAVDKLVLAADQAGFDTITVATLMQALRTKS